MAAANVFGMRSPDFRFALTAALRSPGNHPLNSNTAGQLTVYDATGAALTPPNPVIAIVFAPGPALSGQDRTVAGSTVCGGNNNAAAYLDTAAGINNATGNGTSSFIAGNLLDAAGNPSATFNDRLLVYHRGTVFPRCPKTRCRRNLWFGYSPHQRPEVVLCQPRPQGYYPWAANAGSAGAQVLRQFLWLDCTASKIASSRRRDPWRDNVTLLWAELLPATCRGSRSGSRTQTRGAIAFAMS